MIVTHRDVRSIIRKYNSLADTTQTKNQFVVYIGYLVKTHDLHSTVDEVDFIINFVENNYDELCWLYSYTIEHKDENSKRTLKLVNEYITMKNYNATSNMPLIDPVDIFVPEVKRDIMKDRQKFFKKEKRRENKQR